MHSFGKWGPCLLTEVYKMPKNYRYIPLAQAFMHVTSGLSQQKVKAFLKTCQSTVVCKYKKRIFKRDRIVALNLFMISDYKYYMYYCHVLFEIKVEQSESVINSIQLRCNRLWLNNGVKVTWTEM